MKFVLAALILFFANVVMANECHDRALAAAKKIDGGASGSGGGGGRGPSGASGSGKVEKGMLDTNGNPVSELQAQMANGRADAIRKATGRDLTPEQATALLNDSSAKALLGDDYKYYLAERAKPGGAAILKAEEAAKTAAEAEAARKKLEEEARAKAEADRKRAEAQARLKEQERLDAEERARETAALDRRQAASQNPYASASTTYKPTFQKDASQMDGIAARQSLSNYASADAPTQAARVFSGMENAMKEMQQKITNLRAAIAESEAADKAKKLSGDGVRTTNLKNYLERARQECANFGSIATTAGLTGGEIQSRISSFISSYCR